MAHFVTRIRTEMPPEAAFSYVGDLRNLDTWDPGVVSSVQVVGDGLGVGSAYDVTVTPPVGTPP